MVCSKSQQKDHGSHGQIIEGIRQSNVIPLIPIEDEVWHKCFLDATVQRPPMLLSDHFPFLIIDTSPPQNKRKGPYRLVSWP